jgi:hypothetical protein
MKTATKKPAPRPNGKPSARHVQAQELLEASGVKRPSSAQIAAVAACKTQDERTALIETWRPADAPRLASLTESVDESPDQRQRRFLRSIRYGGQ